GHFTPDPQTGVPQLVTDTGVVTGNPGAPVHTGNALRLSQSVLDDIAHGAAPAFSEDPLDCGPEEGPPCLAGYDHVLLGEHFITGDGRGNENIGLTAVHHVFHAEHNRLLEAIKDTLDDPANADLKAAYEDQSEADDWNYGQRIFQAARFGTEMQYQHLVFEEFARTVQPTIDGVVFNENAYDSTIDPSINAEFAHVVYRFGHSMLTQQLAREGFGAEPAALLDGFLNPVAYTCRIKPSLENTCADADVMTPEEAAGAIVNGTTDQAANQIDELVTSTLRNNLLGLPLDLATINLLRARDAGVPPLQEARAQFYAETGDPALRPYRNWLDFDYHLRNGDNFGRDNGSQASLVNFIAAYGTHPTVEAATSLVDKRVAAEALVHGAVITDRVDRAAGANRFGTGAALSQSRYPAPPVPVVYIARADTFPDALAGGPAAAAEGGPLLLVEQNSVPLPTALELVRLNPAKIVVLGGNSAVSPAVASQLQTFTAGAVDRLSGDNRFSTAAAISQYVYPAGADTVFISTGGNFPDALAAGPAAARNNAPLLLVERTSIPAATALELDRLAPSEIVIVGGPGAVTDGVLAGLASSTGANVTRAYGAGRYETAVEVSKQNYPDGHGGVLYLATGENFPDALSASAVAGAGGEANSPILLVPGGATIPTAVEEEILRLAPDKIIIAGGAGAVSTAAETALEALFPVPTAPDDRLDF